MHSPMSSRRAGFVAHICAALVTVFAGTADAQPPVITFAPPVVASGPDYATDVLANPWDFTDVMDLSPFPDEFSGWTNSSTTARTLGRAAFLSGGQFVARTATGGANLIPLLFRGGSDFITSMSENSGVFDHKAIPTALYGKLAVAMTLNASTGGQLSAYWHAAPYNALDQRAGGVAFKTPQAGTHIYIVDLVTGVWTDARGNPATPFFVTVGDYPRIAWNGASLMRGFQIRATSDGGATVDVNVDWVRLTQRDGNAGVGVLPITFTGCAGRDYNVEVLAGGNWEIIHTGTAASSGATTANVNHGVLAPGNWSFRVTCYPVSRAPSGGNPVSSPAVTIAINSPPLVSVQSPDAVGGPDFATEVIGNPWDMNALSDIRQYFGVTNPSIVFDGVSNTVQATATSTGDPALVYVYGAPQIDTSRYRSLTFSLALDTPFALAGPGAGSVARAFWERPSSTGGNAVTTTKDIIVWPGRNVYTIDLSQLSFSNNLLETACLPNCGVWSAGPVRYFRIDPHESTLGVRFRIGPTLLAGPDEVALGSTFPVQYSFADSDTSGSSYTARIYLDTDRNAGTRTLIDAVPGVAPNTPLTYVFDPAGRGVPAGEYFLFIEVTENRSSVSETHGIYSSGPLRVFTGNVLSPPGSPTLSAVQVSANPVTVAWSPGPGGAPTNYTLAVGTSAGASNVAVFNLGTATQASGNAPPGVRLYVRVVASNGAGSAVSNEISFVVGSGVAPPAPPTMNSPTVSGRNVFLSWNPSGAGGPASYYILVARFAGNASIIGTLPVGGTSVTVPNVPPGDYVAAVLAVNSAGMSAESGGVVVNVR